MEGERDLAVKKKCPRCGSELVSETGKACFACEASWHYCPIANRVTWSHTEDKCLETCIRLVGEAVDEIERRSWAGMEYDYSSL